MRILSIDPSGTGTSGVYYWDGELEKFSQFTGKEWLEHFKFILDLVEEYQPNLLLFENSNYVSLRGKDMTYLWKLLGAIEILPSVFPSLQAIQSIPVNQVKELRSKLLKRTSQIPEINYKPGKGWYYSGKKISTHELDAYLVYWLWQSKETDKEKVGLSFVYQPTKTKQELKLKNIKEELPEDIAPEIEEGLICGNINNGPDIDDYDYLTEEEEINHD